MSSQQPKPKEEKLYLPILEALRDIFDRWYVAESYAYVRNLKNRDEDMRRAPSGSITNPHLEITAHGEFPDKLQRLFDKDLFAALYAEKLKPDIMGYVKKKNSSKPEVITIEVKAGALKIRDVLQAKMYSDIFKAKFAFAISPKGISTPKLRVILDHDKALRGNVIIASYNQRFESLCIHPELKKHVPKELQRFCK